MSKQIDQRGIDGLLTCIGQHHLNTASITWIGYSADQTPGLEPVDAVGHRAAGDECQLNKASRRQRMWCPGPAERGEYIELPGVEFMGLKGFTSGQIQMSRQPAYPRENFQWCNVDIGSLASPRTDEAVDLILSCDVLVAGEVVDRMLIHRSSLRVISISRYFATGVLPANLPIMQDIRGLWSGRHCRTTTCCVR